MMSIKELLCTLIIYMSIATAAIAQEIDAPEPQTGHIIGTVTDVNNDTIPGADVVLEGPILRVHRAVRANDNGFFEFKTLEPNTPYHITVSAKGFANWLLLPNPQNSKMLTVFHAPCTARE